MAKAATPCGAGSCRRKTSLALGALPIGLAHRLPLVRAVPQGEVVRWSDVDISHADALTGDAIKARRAMEAEYGGVRVESRETERLPA